MDSSSRERIVEARGGLISFIECRKVVGHLKSAERSHSGLVHLLGKQAYRKVSRVRIPPSPP